MGPSSEGPSVAFEDETDIQLLQLRRDVAELGIFETPIPYEAQDLIWHKVKDVQERLFIHSDKSKFAYTLYAIEDKKGRPVSYAIKTESKWACHVFLCSGSPCEFSQARASLEIGEETKELAVMKFRESIFQWEVAHVDGHLQAIRELIGYMMSHRQAMKLREKDVKQRSKRLLTTYSVVANSIPDEPEDALDRLQMEIDDLHLFEYPEGLAYRGGLETLGESHLKFMKLRDNELKRTRYAIKADGKWACVLWHRSDECDFNKTRTPPSVIDNNRDVVVMKYSEELLNGELAHIGEHLTELNESITMLKVLKNDMVERLVWIKKRCKPLSRRIKEVRCSRKKTRPARQGSNKAVNISRAVCSKQKRPKSILKTPEGKAVMADIEMS